MIEVGETALGRAADLFCDEKIRAEAPVPETAFTSPAEPVQVLADARVREARDQAQCAWEDLVAHCVTAEGSTFKFFEEDLRARLFTLGCLLATLFLCAREVAVARRVRQTVPADHRVKAPVPRTLTTSLGPVRYARTYLARKVGYGGYFPLDVELGLTADRFSTVLVGLGAQLATRMSYSSAVVLMGRMLGTSPSVETLEKWVLGLGRQASVYAEVAPPEDAEGHVLVIQVDGRCIPTITDDELSKRRGPRKQHDGTCRCGCQRHRGVQARQRRGSKKRRLPGDKSKNGRSVTLVVMYTLRRTADGQLHGPLNKRVFGTLAPRREAIAWARREATRRGFPPGTRKQVQVVVDGELCLEAGLREAFPDADITLDIRHVEEKLWHTGEAFHAAQTEELKMWVEHHRTLLYAGRARDLVQALDALHAQLPTHAHRKRSRVAKLANYLRKRLPMMNYKELIQRDLEIASGVVEGATRYVIGERLDCSGMRWLEGRAEALLRLRCLELNGQWDSFLEWAQQDWLLRLSAKKPVRIRTVAPMDLSVAA